MKYLIEAPDILDTTIELPSSKSISNRALIISAMASAYNNEPLVLPDNLSDCDDTEVVVNALKNMPETIDIKAAGTAMRFMTAWLCICYSSGVGFQSNEQNALTMELHRTGDHNNSSRGQPLEGVARRSGIWHQGVYHHFTKPHKG